LAGITALEGRKKRLAKDLRKLHPNFVQLDGDPFRRRMLLPCFPDRRLGPITRSARGGIGLGFGRVADDPPAGPDKRYAVRGDLATEPADVSNGH
jgi:hypothetical protein